jgi:hypothetical protein
MDLRSIVLHLNRKGLKTEDIRDDLIATIGGETIAYFTMTNSFSAV